MRKNYDENCDIAGAFSEYVLVEDAAYNYNLMKLAADVIEAFNNINTHRTNTPKIVTHHFKHEDII